MFTFTEILSCQAPTNSCTWKGEGTCPGNPSVPYGPLETKNGFYFQDVLTFIKNLCLLISYIVYYKFLVDVICQRVGDNQEK